MRPFLQCCKVCLAEKLKLSVRLGEFKQQGWFSPVGQGILAGVPSLQRHWSKPLPVWRRASFHSQRICFSFQATLWAACTALAPTKTSSSPSVGGGWSDHCQAPSGTPIASVPHKMPSHPGSELQRKIFEDRGLPQAVPDTIPNKMTIHYY